MRFDDDKYIEDVKLYNKYPKIHNDIFYLSNYIQANNVLDIGCCTGLLSHRLANVYNYVIGIEANKKFIEKAIPKDNVNYINLKINSDNLNKLKDIILNNNIEVIFARRVFPELYDTGGIELLDSLCDIFNNCNIQYIVIEGRKPVRNAKNPLNTLDEEIKHFSKFYVQHKKYKNCCILKRK